MSHLTPDPGTAIDRHRYGTKNTPQLGSIFCVHPEFTTAEAAYLANACLAAEAETSVSAREILFRSALSAGPISERSVTKAIEERVVKATRRRARVTVSTGAVLYVVATKRLAEITLSKKAKRRLYGALSEIEKPTKSWKVELAPSLAFEPGEAMKRWMSFVRTYAAARDRFITIDPNIMGGTPVVRGTRIPVYSVLARIEGGDTLDDLVEDYPVVKREAFEAAAAYARTHPRRGRPKKRFRKAVCRTNRHRESSLA